MGNDEIARSWFQQVWNDGDESAIDRLMAPNATFHGLQGGPFRGPAAFKPFFRKFREAFPDIHVRVEQTVCEGEWVACRCTVTATHRGASLGVEATNATTEFSGMAMAKVRDGLIHEGWNCFDNLTLYQSLGMLPQLPAA